MSADEITVIPATAMQESLWWIHQRARDKSVYNLTWRLTCDGPLDLAALRLAWQAVVGRHETLRGCLRREQDRLEFVVAPRLAARFGTIAVDDPGPLDGAELLRLIAEEVQSQVLDLARPGLARLTAVRVGDAHELLITAHHVVSDGWAMQLLIEDLSHAYGAVRAGRQPEFADEPVSFADYAHEQRRAADGAWRDGVEYWRELLDGATASTIAADQHGEFLAGSAGAVLHYVFSEEATAGITALARATHATPFAIMLGALKVVLSRGGAGSDVAVGIVVANRMTAAEQRLVGYTANLCVARTAVDGGDTVAEVVARVRDAMWLMLAHQSVPYPTVFTELSEQTQQGLTDTPPLLLSYLGGIGDDLALDDVRLHRNPSRNRAARADITTTFWAAGETYQAEIEYNTSRYRAATVLALLHDLDEVLAIAGEEPATTVEFLTLSSRAVPSRLDHHRSDGRRGTASLPTGAGWQPVVDAWTELLGAPPAGPDADFFDAGGNSLRVLRLAELLEAAGGRRLELLGWLAEPTPRRLVDQFGASGQAAEPPGPGTPTGSIHRLAEGAGPHLHLLPGAGGGVTDYRDLVAALPGDWQVTMSVVDAPADDPEPVTVPALARHHLAALTAAGLRPDVIGGWSLGGQLAYEIVAGLPEPRPRLLVIDSTPPQGHAAGQPPAASSRLAFDSFAEVICESAGLAGVPVPQTDGDPDLAVGALAALLTAAGEPTSGHALRGRWREYHRQAQAVVGYLRTDRIRAEALIVGAALSEPHLAAWAERVSRPSVVRLPAGHYGVLRATAAELSAAVAAWVAGAVPGEVLSG
ncbi:MAG TPA: condensation domain-containing protein [Jatrophihabitans sp.]|nr:condensation domain-containing protein [Jatrophihabitans sp.]